MDGHTDSIDMSLSKVQETVKDGEDWRAIADGSQRVRHNVGMEQPPRLKTYNSSKKH